MVLYGDVVFIDLDNINLDKALSAITRELEKNKDNWEAWAAKADILYSIGLYENAILCCDRSLAINPDNSFTEATKANALIKLKRRNETKADHSNSMLCSGIAILSSFLLEISSQFNVASLLSATTA